MARRTRLINLLVAVLVLTGTGTGVSILATSAHASTPVPASGCPVTAPNGSTPPNERPGAGWHGNGAIWVGLPIDGTFSAPPDDTGGLDPPAEKIVWFRADTDAELHIHGHALTDPTREVLVERPDGYESHVQVSAITFPGNGCWVLHSTTWNDTLTVIVLVNRPG